MKTSMLIKKTSFLVMIGLVGNLTAQPVELITAADCGKSLLGNTSYELTENLACDISALLLAEENTNLSLAGHTISFSGNGVPPDGIMITGSNNTISGQGTIIGFDNNISLSFANTNTITYVTILDALSNGILLVSSTQNTLSSNKIENSGTQGISATESSNNTFTRNQILNSGVNGIYLFNDGINLANSDSNNITYNIVYKTGIDGIKIESHALASVSNNTISFNEIIESQRFAVSLVASNGFTENNIIENNSIFHYSGVSIALSDCTKQTNIWKENTVNIIRTITGTPRCLSIDETLN